MDSSVSLDGEPHGTTPTTISVPPGAPDSVVTLSVKSGDDWTTLGADAVVEGVSASDAPVPHSHLAS
jgi:hypothetical protein